MTTTSTPSLEAALAELEAELSGIDSDTSAEVIKEEATKPKTKKAAVEAKVDDSAAVLAELDELLNLDLDALDVESTVVTLESTAVVIEDSADATIEQSSAVEEIDDLEAELAAMTLEMRSSAPAELEVTLDAEAVVLDTEEALVEDDIVSDADSELADLDAALADLDATDDSPATDTEEPKKAPKPKARACGATNPFDALIARLGGVDAVSSNVVLTLADAEKSPEVLRDEFKDIVNDMAKKVGEKAVNLLAHLQGNAVLSVYTVIALEMLLKNGTLTSKELFDRYMKRPYSEGTSRSQSGQLMQLLPALKIANRVGKSLELNEDSVLAAALRSTIESKAA